MLIIYKLRCLFFPIVTLLLAGNLVDAQNQSDNLVPNPGFEQFSGVPLGWFYKGKHFTSVMKYWSSPTSASPDIFGNRVRIPRHWAEKGFGKHPARSGKAMAGITVYGCEDGKPHCREYLQIQLSEPLVPEQRYYLEFWVSHLAPSLQSNNLSAAFSNNKINLLTDEQLTLSPAITAKNIISIPEGQWTVIAGYFTAKESADYLIIGNFQTDELTRTRANQPDTYNYAYYYVDDVLLRKEKPVLPVPVAADDLTKISLETGKVVPLKNIFFETSRAELLPRSFTELNKLVQIMEKNPDMIIEVRGHTDIRGSDQYNQHLSEQRAKAVALFLLDNGIEPGRVAYKGFGSHLPAATNTTSTGRQQNRRVEFRIVSNDIN